MAFTWFRGHRKQYVCLFVGTLHFLTRVCTVGCASPTCSLYESGSVGINCFHGDKLTRALTNSSTAWVVEFYSSWCGHCQHFAPTWKELGKDIRAWSSIVRIGILECSVSQTNRDICTAFKIQGYPTIKMFYPNDPNPSNFEKSYFGARDIKSLREAIVDHVESVAKRPDSWPNFQPLVNDGLLSLPASAWKPTAFIFEEDRSYMGREVILDFSFARSFTVMRVSKSNLALVRHYSVLEFPSMVVEVHKDDYHVIAVHSSEDPRTELGKVVKTSLLKLSSNRASRLHPITIAPTEGGTAAGSYKINRSVTKVMRVNTGDLLSAMSYAFRMEVAVHSIVSGDAFTTLLRFVHLLESAFRVAYPAISVNLWSVRAKLETRQSSGFILNRDWLRIVDTKLDPRLFPKEPKWSNCLGSQPHLRGYPCGLWMLMHTVTLLTLPVKARSSLPSRHKINTKEALHILSSFVKTFFSCESCRAHFSEMALTLADSGNSYNSDTGILYNGDAVLWLWEAHNTVNNRLKNAPSTDPTQPKVLFPLHNMCPYCYTRVGQGAADRQDGSKPFWNNTAFSGGESLLHSAIANRNVDYFWNKTAVLLFLWNFYRVNRSDHTAPIEILHAAWPGMFEHDRSIPKLTHFARNDLEFSIYDLGFCVLAYLACGGLLAVLAHWLVVRKRMSLLRTLLPLR